MSGWRMGALALLLGAATAHASPWAEVGDRQLRADVELLKAAGFVRGPSNSWPLSWAQIDGGLRATEGAALTPHVAAARDRVQRLSDRASRRTNFEVNLAGTNEPQLVRDFGGGARADADLSARVEQDFGRVYVSASIGYRDGGAGGGDVNFDNSYAVAQFGDWAVYGGFLDKYYGPGNDGALLFSNNARPFPKIGVTRLSPAPVDLPVVRWLGPLTLDVFAGILTEDREFDNPAVIGIRLAFEPAQNLEIGLNRALQLCGEDRPCGVKTIGTALIGFLDTDNTGTLNEPGNQLASFDISYSRLFGPVAMVAYFEAVAEDEANVIEQFGRLGGVTLTGALGGRGATWRLGAEYTDTVAAKLYGRGEYPGSLYNQFIYSDGFTYRRRSIGYSLDTDARVTTVFGHVTDAKNRRWYGSVRDIDLNIFELVNASGTNPQPRNRVSANREKINIVTGGVEWPTRLGDICVEGRYQTDSPNTPGREDRRGAVEVAWRSRF